MAANPKNLALAGKKFLKGFDQVCKVLFEDEELEFGHDYKCNYIKFGQLLNELGFLSKRAD